MKKYRALKSISSRGMLRRLRKSALTHTNGYFQYTTLTALFGMLESGKLYLSSKDKLNDLGEGLNENMYAASFCCGTCENLAMWCLYGVPNNEAIRVKFPHDAIMEWLESFKAKGEISIYSVEGGDLMPLNAKIKRVLFTDVAYRDCDVVRHCYDFYKLSKGESWDSERFAGLLKDYAWVYENEVRLIIEFTAPLVNHRGKVAKTIAVDFEEPIDAILEGEYKDKLLVGPWGVRKFSGGRHLVNGHKLDFEVSSLKNLVKCRCNDSVASKRLRKMLKSESTAKCSN